MRAYSSGLYAGQSQRTDTRRADRTGAWIDGADVIVAPRSRVGLWQRHYTTSITFRQNITTLKCFSVGGGHSCKSNVPSYIHGPNSMRSAITKCTASRRRARESLSAVARFHEGIPRGLHGRTGWRIGGKTRISDGLSIRTRLWCIRVGISTEVKRSWKSSPPISQASW